ncbi:MAG: VWA domain-containing protein [Polyangiales bacterium]
MRTRPSSPSLALLLLALQGCGASFMVQGKGASLAVGANGEAVTATPTTDTAAAAAQATVVVSQIAGLTLHAAGQAGRAQAVHGGAIAIEHAGAITASDIVGGDLEIDASAVEGAPSAVRGGTLRLAGGLELRVTGGRVTLGENREGQWVVSGGRVTTVDPNATVTVAAGAAGSAAGATGTPSAGVPTGGTVAVTATGGGSVGAQGGGIATAAGGSPNGATANNTVGGATVAVAAGAGGAAAGGGSVPNGRVTGVDVERVSACGGAHVIAGGEITITGVPQGGDLAVVDGSLEFDDPELAPAAPGRGPRATVRATNRRALRVRAGGTLLVSNRHGRRWRVRVEGGEILARTEGSNPSGRVVWQPTGGEVRVTVVASGGDALALEGGGLPEATVDFSPRVRASLDALVASATPGSREAGRLAAAVEVVLRQAESAEPAFYAIPVRGRSLVVMVDISYSMSDPDPNGAGFASVPTKLDVARAELVKVLASVPQNVTVDVVAFSSTVQRLWDAPRAMDEISLRAAIQWAAALRPADETHPLEAIDAAAAMNPEQIVLLSDGRPSDSDAVLRSLLARVEAIAPRTRVDVVGFGADQDRVFLGALAARGRGTLRLR